MSSQGEEGNVLHVLGELVPHGAELRTLELLESVARRPSGPKQHVVTLSGQEGVLADRFRRASVSVHVGRVRSLGFLSTLSGIVRRNRIRVIHSHVDALSGYLLLLAWLLHVPGRIAHLRSDVLVQYTGLVGRIKGVILRALIARFATAIVAVSPGAMASAWPTWERDPRCLVIPSGIDLDRFDGLVDVERVRAELGLDRERLILHIGRDVPSKNREKARRVAATLAADGRDDVVAFVGARSEPAFDSVNVRQLGVRDDIGSLLRAASAVLLTSRYEGLPGSVLEGLIAGAPVVASDLPGVRYLAEHIAPVVVLSPDDSDRRWADELIEVATDVPLLSSRPTRVAELRGGEFDLENATDRFTELWRREGGRSR